MIVGLLASLTGALTASTCETITGPITKYYLNWGPIELAKLLVFCGLTSVSGYCSLKKGLWRLSPVLNLNMILIISNCFIFERFIFWISMFVILILDSTGTVPFLQKYQNPMKDCYPFHSRVQPIANGFTTNLLFDVSTFGFTLQIRSWVRSLLIDLQIYL